MERSQSLHSLFKDKLWITCFFRSTTMLLLVSAFILSTDVEGGSPPTKQPCRIQDKSQASRYFKRLNAISGLFSMKFSVKPNRKQKMLERETNLIHTKRQLYEEITTV